MKRGKLQLSLVETPLDSEVQLRKLATYLQYRLDKAGEGDMKINREIVGQFIVLIEEVVRYRRERRRSAASVDRTGP